MRYSKYHAKPTFRDGIRFASKKEADRYVCLKMLEKAGKIRNLELQRRFSLLVAGEKIGVYIADFVYEEFLDPQNTRVVVEDVKGMKKGTAYQLYSWKKRHMEAQYNIKILET